MIIQSTSSLKMTSYADPEFFLEIKSARVSSAAASPPDESGAENFTVSNKLGWRFYAAFSCLCVVNLVSALDAACLPVALPVSISLFVIPVGRNTC